MSQFHLNRPEFPSPKHAIFQVWFQWFWKRFLKVVIDFHYVAFILLNDVVLNLKHIWLKRPSIFFPSLTTNCTRKWPSYRKVKWNFLCPIMLYVKFGLKLTWWLRVIMVPSLILNFVPVSLIKHISISYTVLALVHDPPRVMERGTKRNQPWVPTMRKPYTTFSN